MLIATALHDYQPPTTASESDRISLQRGEKVYVLKRDITGWWHGMKVDDPKIQGWFPGTYVKLMPVDAAADLKQGKVQIVVPGKRVPLNDDQAPVSRPSVAAVTPASQNLPDDKSFNVAPIFSVGKDVAEGNQPTVVPNSTMVRVAHPIQQPALPTNWERTKTLDGREYFYNMINNRTVWTREETVSVASSPISPNPPKSPILQGELEMAELNLTADTWDALIKKIVASISLLNEATKMAAKAKYKKLSSRILLHIQEMLVKSRNENLDLLPVESRELMRCVSTFVLSVKSASSVWPPPDANSKLRYHSRKILISLRNYAVAAMESGVEVISPIQDGVFGGLDSAAAAAATTQSPYETALDEPDMINRLDHFSVQIKRNVDSIISYVENNTPKRNDPGGPAGPKKGAQNKEAQQHIIENSHRIITLVGSMMTFLDEMQLETDVIEFIEENQEDIARSTEAISGDSIMRPINGLRVARKEVYHNLSALITSIALAEDEFAPPNATRKVMLNIAVLLRSVKDMVIAVKKLVAEKDILEEKCLFETFEHNDEEYEHSIARKMSSRKTMSFKDLQKQTTLKRNNARSINSSSDSDDFVAVQRGTRLSIDYSASLPPKSTENLSSDGGKHKDMRSHRFFSDSKLRQFFGENNKHVDEKTPLPLASDRNSWKKHEEGHSTHKIKKFFGEDVAGAPVAAPLSATRDSKESTSGGKLATPWYLERDTVKADMLYTKDGEDRVRAGTIAALVERLTPHDSLDMEFQKAFLFTFRMVITPAIFINHLVKRFQCEAPAELTPLEHTEWKDRKQKPIQLRVCVIVKRWIEDYWFERIDSESLPLIKNFAKEILGPTYPKESERIVELCIKRETLRDDDMVNSKLTLNNIVVPFSEKPPAPLMSGPSRLGSHLIEADITELARQISLLESKVFLLIHPVEIMYYNAERKLEDDGIKKMITRSNQITGWVAESILVEKDLKKRVELVKFFIKLAEKCHTLSNFATREAILAALNSTPIYRLKKTWEALPGKFRSTFETLAKYMDRDNNFSTYRSTLKNTFSPCVPFLGLYLTDMTFIKQGNPERLSNGRLINFDRCFKIGTIVEDIHRLQSSTYNFVPLPDMQDELMGLLQNSRDIQDLHNLSLTIEPREKQLKPSTSGEKVLADEDGALLVEKLIENGFL